MSSSLRPSVCIDAVLGELPVGEATRIVKDSGIPAFEFWGWWDKDLDQLLAAKDATGLQISACCTKFISLVDPEKRAEYLAGLEESITAAKRLGCRTLISQVGDLRVGVDRAEQHQALVDGLKAAASLVEAADIALVIEPLNEQVDHPGYYLVKSDEAFQIIDEVGSSHVKVVFDIYHQQISEGQLIHNITSNIDKIGHFHAAGNPGRHELTVGEIHYPQIFDAIRGTTYNGYVGLEYWPIKPVANGLGEVANWFQ
ncbi:hydroxypyruvate isomerase family protein [Planctomycetota bacterium]